MEDLCEKIDKVLVQFMDTLTDLYKEQARLEESMKAGYLNMSRARYNMGIRSVGIQQCDENKMDAHVKVNVEDNQFNLENISDLESQLSDLDIGGDDGKGDSDKSGLRKRTVQKEDNSPNVSSEKDSIQEINLKDIKKTGPFDPLKWFGVLVPQALRQSQSEFKSSVETAVSVANLKTKLVNLQNEYNDLLLQKKSMGPFDPLKWFGVLVPQALRQSQSEFKSTVETAVSVANLKTKLVNLQNEYNDLLLQKKSMDD